MEGVTRTGDLVVYDSHLPFETQPRDGYLLTMWLLPRALLEPHLPALGRPLATILSGRSGVEALAASYLDALTLNWDSLSEAAMEPVADTLARLIGIACGAAAAEQPDAVRAGRLVEAKRHIDRHLADPALSPASVAGALGIGVRTLHLLFEPTGASFARYVLRRRLEACREALLSCPTRPVTDIAFGWGFNNLSTFYRAFQAAFGMRPGELRATSRGAQRS
jgi:AraC-like DNA-binding protein